MALTPQQIGTIIEGELADAEGDEHDQLSEHRENALRYFQNKPKGDELPGRSHVNSGDFADMVEAALAEMLPLFTGSSIVTFEAESEEDEEQSMTESQFVQHMVERSGGFILLAEAIKDALMMRNGWIRATIDEEEVKNSETISDVTEEELVQLLAGLERDWDSVDYTLIKNDGEGLVSARVTAKRTERSLNITTVRPEDIRYSSEHDQNKLEGIRFFAEREELTRSELKRMGLPPKDVDMMAPMHHRDGAQQERQGQQEGSARDPVQRANDIIETFLVYLQVDESGNNGLTELRSYRYIPDSPQKTYLPSDPKIIPYAHGAPFIFPHRVSGWDLFDKLKGVEDSKRFTLRQLHDNMSAMNNTRKIAARGRVNKKSLLESRPGGVIWCDEPTQDVVTEQKVPIIGEGIQFLSYLDKLRTEKGGASLDMLNPEFQLAGKNAGDAGIFRQLGQKEKLVALMTRTLAETMIKRLYYIVHEQLRLFMPGELSAKLNGKWQQTDPSQWRKRKHSTVNVGMSGGERQEKAIALEGVMDSQRNLAEFGFDGTMVTEKNIYNAQVEWMNVNGIHFSEKFLLDPESDEANQARAKKQEQQQQAQAEQEELMEQVTEIQNRLEQYRIDKDMVLGILKEEVKLAIEEAKIMSSPLPIDQQQQEMTNQSRQL